ncbi:peptidase M43 family protein [Metarhizium robertsii]|nr:peptidase M43 family protein [Metarhizium robertsii]
MSLLTFLVAMLMANAVNAGAIHVRQEAASPCEEQVPSQEFVEISRKLRLEASNSSLTRRQLENANIQVYAHVVFDYGRADGGYVQQYRYVGISFTLADVSYTRNTQWAYGYDEIRMKYYLRRGGYADLNMYFIASFPGEERYGPRTFGICYYPIPRQLEYVEFIRDGCTVIAQSVPGVEGWVNQNHIATHEVGHYLGLYHTFESGNWGERRCFPGDDIDDTYPQEEPSRDDPRPKVWACGGWRRSNMYNFMDYS